MTPQRSAARLANASHLTSRLLRAVATSAIATSLLLGSGAQAAAAAGPSCRTGTCGSHDAPEVSCDLRLSPTVTVHDSYIESTYVYEPGLIGPNHKQWVGTRRWLLKWNGSTWAYTDQNRDGRLDYGPLLQAQVTNGFGSWLPTQWYNADNKTWTSGATAFAIRDAGSYRVRAEYYWYEGSTVSGYDVLDSVYHYVNLGVLDQAQAWCQY
jgi:hypothetical protein